MYTEKKPNILTLVLVQITIQALLPLASFQHSSLTDFLELLLSLVLWPSRGGRTHCVLCGPADHLLLISDVRQ